jgi:hypothetical protein
VGGGNFGDVKMAISINSATTTGRFTGIQILAAGFLMVRRSC